MDRVRKYLALILQWQRTYIYSTTHACTSWKERDVVVGGRLFPRRWRCTQAVVSSCAAKVVE
jgi:hypothetical protein